MNIDIYYIKLAKDYYHWHRLHLHLNCTLTFIKDLGINNHNNVIHAITVTLPSHNITRNYALVNVSTNGSTPQNNTILTCLLWYTCTTCQCTCLICPKSIYKHHWHSQEVAPPSTPTLTITIQFIEFNLLPWPTHKKIHSRKHDNPNMLIDALLHKDWIINPLVVSTIRARGAFHTQTMEYFKRLKIPKYLTKNQMEKHTKYLPKYLTFVILDKKKFKKKTRKKPTSNPTLGINLSTT